jgi:hypothetical protein
LKPLLFKGKKYLKNPVSFLGSPWVQKPGFLIFISVERSRLFEKVGFLSPPSKGGLGGLIPHTHKGRKKTKSDAGAQTLGRAIGLWGKGRSFLG